MVTIIIYKSFFHCVLFSMLAFSEKYSLLLPDYYTFILQFLNNFMCIDLLIRICHFSELT